MEMTKNMKIKFRIGAICFFMASAGSFINLFYNKINESLVFLILGMTIYNFFVISGILEELYPKQDEKNV